MGERMSKTVVVHRPVNEVYNLWANFDNFPNFMRHIKEVRKIGERESHWIMDGPMGKDVEWRARTTTMEPNRRIAWSSYEGDVDTNGEVSFREVGSNETEVTVMMQYAAKGAIADFVAKYFTNTGDWMEEDLRNFKRYAEEVGTSGKGVSGRVGSTTGETETYGTMGTGTHRERTGAGAFGSTPGGTMGTPTGGAIGGTTGGSTGGSTGSTGSSYGTSTSGSTPGTFGKSPSSKGGGSGTGTSGERGTTDPTRGETSGPRAGGTGTSSTSGGTRTGAGGFTSDRSISGDREHSDKLDRDRDISDRDRNRDREDL